MTVTQETVVAAVAATMVAVAAAMGVGEMAAGAATDPNGLVTMRSEIPFQGNGVAVDLLSPEAGEDFLEATLAAPPGTMMEAAPLVYMKLKSPRRKDQVDVIEMIKGGIDTKRCREVLSAHAPELVAVFDETFAQAEAEQN